MSTFFLWAVVVAVQLIACVTCRSQQPRKLDPNRSSAWPAHPLYPFPNGEYTHGSEFIPFASISFTFVSVGEDSATLQAAFQRYRPFIDELVPRNSVPRRQNIWDEPPPFRASRMNVMMERLEVNVASADMTLSLDTDESYLLTVDSPVSTLSCNTVYGCMWGLETFSQMITDSPRDGLGLGIRNAPVFIADAPRFKWRGLLLDVVNHFIPVSQIKKQIDALSWSKMNVLHWHPIDSYSFPYVSSSHPDLHVNGAWCRTCIYTPQDVQDVIEYGRMRGVRVIAEVNSPGHTWAIGLTYPETFTQCPSYEPLWQPLDLSKPKSFEVMEDLIREVARTFPDQYFHVGGDEVQFECWAEDPDVVAYMQEMNFTTFNELWQYYEDKVMTWVAQEGKTPVVWHEAFLNLNLPSNTVVEVWNEFENIQRATSAGYTTIVAMGYYLDRQVPVPPQLTWHFEDTFRQMYLSDPTLGLSEENARRVIGGEAQMWIENVSLGSKGGSEEGRIWPRAAAIGERLWSPEDMRETEIDGPMERRLVDHRCRIVTRGILAAAIWADYCEAADS